jgi:serine/threonine protein phosphatase PrpC
MQVAGLTHIGNVRNINEDKFYIGEPYLFIIADGMGGHKAGEIASSNAVDFIKDMLLDDLKNDGIDKLDMPDRIVEAVIGANKHVYNKSLTDKELLGMGTTIVCMVIYENKAYIANVGDSRLYIIRNNSIVQITHDHSYVAELLKAGNITEEEAIHHSKKNLITRAVGYQEHVEVDIQITEIFESDILLMCTDGITNMISDLEVMEIIKSNDDINKNCNYIVEEANRRGGFDNSTLIIIKV